MENIKENYVINGGVKMPVGYRFRPTDEELVLHYLMRKVHAAPLPASIIPEFDVFETHPWGLPGDVRGKRYFFHNENMNKNVGINSKRAAGCGYWKPIGKKKQIVNNSESNEAVGIRKTLVFCERKRRRCHHHHHGSTNTTTQTRWLMHEYRLLASQANPTQVLEKESGNWVVCRIFQKKRRPTQRTSDDMGVVSQRSSNCKKTRRLLEDYISADDHSRRSDPDLTTLSSPSCSSDITHELSSNDNGELDDDQEGHSVSMPINI
ncbi:hypothetical protein ACFX13_045466 [Malus domestica]|uniref:NAC domain class transcription factor n=1 Tax=Malus domestica TaxID=3750 RepID=D9ZJA6_MALDO|nr:NAC domain-containing protein 83 [Malus domestica]XP_050103706.1 NAC domain-containing protein 83-like [Malus sylvestris]ADL36809.1 NAC domain class transcription factor [Malus domestica]RXH89211.1 hypothetical protein DVH24_031568 [Malus domestica]